MLKTKSVQYLQSRPHHIRVMIFVFVMITAGAISLSFLANSLSDNFIAADVKKAKEGSETVEVATTNDVNSPSILENLKSNIGDFGNAVSSIFSNTSENGDKISGDKNSIQKENNLIRETTHHSIGTGKIIPAQLPVDQQQ